MRAAPLTQPAPPARDAPWTARPGRSRRDARPLRPGATADGSWRGWLVVAGAFAVLLVGFGAAYAFGAFAATIAAAFAVSHAQASLVHALCCVLAFGLGVASGPLADRIGCRAPATLGMALVGLGLLLAATATGFAGLLLSYGLLVGVGIGLAYVPALAAIQPWFRARRGLATGIAGCGIGVGTALAAPATEALLALGGWRTAFAVLGVAALVVGLAAAQPLALRPPAASPPAGAARRAGAVRMADAPRRFAVLYLGCLLVSAAMSLPFAHLVSFAEAGGVGRAEAVRLLALLGLASIPGRFVIAAAADRLGRPACLVACGWAVAGSLTLWASAGAAPALAAFAVLFGAVHGGFVALLPAVAVDLFGERGAGWRLGLLFTARALGLAAPPLVAALVQAGAGVPAPLLAAAALAGGGAVLIRRSAARAPRAASAFAPAQAADAPA